jgi:hypothetical protein
MPDIQIDVGSTAHLRVYDRLIWRIGGIMMGKWQHKYAEESMSQDHFVAFSPIQTGCYSAYNKTVERI